MIRGIHTTNQIDNTRSYITDVIHDHNGWNEVRHRNDELNGRGSANSNVVHDQMVIVVGFANILVIIHTLSGHHNDVN